MSLTQKIGAALFSLLGGVVGAVVGVLAGGPIGAIVGGVAGAGIGIGFGFMVGGILDAGDDLKSDSSPLNSSSSHATHFPSSNKPSNTYEPHSKDDFSIGYLRLRKAERELKRDANVFTTNSMRQ